MPWPPGALGPNSCIIHLIFYALARHYMGGPLCNRLDCYCPFCHDDDAGGCPDDARPRVTALARLLIATTLKRTSVVMLSASDATTGAGSHRVVVTFDHCITGLLFPDCRDHAMLIVLVPPLCHLSRPRFTGDRGTR